MSRSRGRGRKGTERPLPRVAAAALAAVPVTCLCGANYFVAESATEPLANEQDFGLSFMTTCPGCGRAHFSTLSYQGRLADAQAFMQGLVDLVRERGGKVHDFVHTELGPVHGHDCEVGPSDGEAVH